MDESYLIEVKRNQVKMVEDRGYDVSTDKYQEIIAKYKAGVGLREIFTVNYRHKTNPKRFLHVGYVGNIPTDKKRKRLETIPQKLIEPYISYLYENAGIYESILIVPVKLDNIASDFLAKALGQTTIKHQIFLEEELSYNVIQHIDVSKHTLLTRDQVIKLLSDTKTNITQLPLIKVNDPVIKYYG